MTSQHLDRGLSLLGPSKNPAEPRGVEATGSFIGPLSRDATASGRSSGREGLDFLRVPQAEGDLGCLGPYRVKGVIGEGNLGLVFLAEDAELARPVALKVIKPGLAEEPEVRNRFVREAQATAAIKHDHVVTVYQVGRDEGTLFLAMEYLRGVSLQDWLERGRKPSTDLVLRIGREVASGLAAVHEKGLVHRDIKPANIWLEAPSGRVKILDFGIVRSERDDLHITHAGTVIGTPAFMAPEQASGAPASPSSDLFSLGCVLYRLLAGRLPFEGQTILAVLSALASETPRPLREVEPVVRPELDELVMRLLAKDPSVRPGSARAVVDAIRAIEREIARGRLGTSSRVDSQSPEGSTITTGIVVSPAEGVQTASSRHQPRTVRIASIIVALGVVVMAVVGFAIRHRAYDGTPARTAVTTPDPVASPVAPQLTKDEVTPPPAQALVDVPSIPPSEPKTSGDSALQPAGPTVSAVSPPPDISPPPGAPVAAVQPASDDEPSSDRAVLSVTADATPARTLILGDWLKPVDPDGDSRFDLDRAGNRIKITVPGVPHLLSAELGRMNAPRVLRPVRGDFVATAKLAGAPSPSSRSSTKAYAPYHGAGFLLWQDAGNYVRFEIAADFHHGKRRPYANFELRKNGALAVSWGIAITDGSTCLRVEKRGDEIRAAFSADEIHWTRFEPITTDFDSNLALGVVAVNSSVNPLTAELEDLAITAISPAEADGGEGADHPPVPEARPSPWPSKRSEAPSRLDRLKAPSPEGER